MQKLPENEIHKQLEELNDIAKEAWKYKDDELTKLFEFHNFSSAFDFVKEIGLAADSLDHHPKIVNDYNKVELLLTTHEVEGVSFKDFDLANRIEKIFISLE
ncbi:MAG: 4a-hydroxytetrahydrobiopterin dehydratase [Patescibacteria group bacterium]